MKPNIISTSEYVDLNDLDTLQTVVPTLPLKVQSWGDTFIGKRETNEDQYAITRLAKMMEVSRSSFPQPVLQQSTEEGHLFVVADGMGGHVAGEEASAIAVDSIEQFLLDTLKWFFCLPCEDGHEVLRDFQQALGQANARLVQRAEENPLLHGMGTTLTMAFYLHPHLYVAHAGDSRCYLFRERQLLRITQDHTFAEEMVTSGAMTPEEAEESTFRHVLTNSLGGGDRGVRVDIHQMDLMPEDRILLCTDGLSGVVEDTLIATVLDEYPDPREATERLIALSRELEGSDNATAIVVRLEVPPTSSLSQEKSARSEDQPVETESSEKQALQDVPVATPVDPLSGDSLASVS